MDNQDQSKRYRCYGSMQRKQRHWPPTAHAAPSEANQLRKRSAWQPQAWQKAHFL